MASSGNSIFQIGASGLNGTTSSTSGNWRTGSGVPATMQLPAQTVVCQLPRHRTLAPLRSISQAYRDADSLGGGCNKPVVKWHPVCCITHDYSEYHELPLMPEVCSRCGQEKEDTTDVPRPETEDPARRAAQASDTGDKGTTVTKTRITGVGTYYGPKGGTGPYNSVLLDGGNRPLPAEVTAGEIIAWRIWRCSDTKPILVSSSMETVWTPGIPMQGNPDKEHEGVHAAKDRLYVARMAPSFAATPGQFHPAWGSGKYCLYVIGKVALWGKVIEHDWGYRAQYASIVEITKVAGLQHVNLLQNLRAKYTPINGFPQNPLIPPPLPKSSPVKPAPPIDWEKTIARKAATNDIDAQVIASEATRDAIRDLTRRTDRAWGRFNSWPSAFGYKGKD